MSTLVNTKLDFGAARRITNLAAGAANGEPVVFEQLAAAIEGIAWKDNARVAGQVNITIAAPGANIDGIAMVVNDRFLAANQTVATENGVYIWTTRSPPPAAAASFCAPRPRRCWMPGSIRRRRKMSSSPTCIGITPAAWNISRRRCSISRPPK